MKTPLHKNIGALKIKSYKKGRIMGTGVLISPNLVLTSAHNVYDRDEKEILHDV